MKTFPLQIISPEKTVFNQSVVSVNLPTKEGELTILADHAPIVTLLATGVAKVALADTTESATFVVHGGSLEVKPHNEGVVLLIDELIDVQKFDGLDLDEEIKKAKEQAKKSMQNDDAQFAVYEGELEKYLYLDKILKNKR